MHFVNVTRSTLILSLVCGDPSPTPMTKYAETGKTEADLRCFIHYVLNKEVAHEQNTVYVRQMNILLFSVFMK